MDGDRNALLLLPILNLFRGDVYVEVLNEDMSAARTHPGHTFTRAVLIYCDFASQKSHCFVVGEFVSAESARNDRVCFLSVVIIVQFPRPFQFISAQVLALIVFEF